MDQIWLEIAKQAPNLAVLVLLVIYFISQMKEAAEVLREGDRENSEKLSAVIERNSTALERSSEALGRSGYLIDKYANGRAKKDDYV